MQRGHDPGVLLGGVVGGVRHGADQLFQVLLDLLGDLVGVLLRHIGRRDGLRCGRLFRFRGRIGRLLCRLPRGLLAGVPGRFFALRLFGELQQLQIVQKLLMAVDVGLDGLDEAVGTNIF